MYDIRQFRPTLYVLVLLGISAFAYAADLAWVWVLAMLAIGLNAFLVSSNRFAPLPRWLASVITIGSFVYLALQLPHAGNQAVLVIGEYLVFLQIIKFYEQRANRDYGQLLILSLLLVIAASINTASLSFAVMLGTYLCLSLYCALLFHLKVEADKAKALQTLPPAKVSAESLRQDQRHLAKSMRRLTGLVAFFSLFTAVLVFIFFPRGVGSGMLGDLSVVTPVNVTGLSDNVDLSTGQRIEQSNAIVAYVQLFQGPPDRQTQVDGKHPLYLRSNTFERYVKDSHEAWIWLSGREYWMKSMTLGAGHPTSIDSAQQEQPGQDEYREIIDLPATGDNHLFSLAGVRSITSQRELGIVYYPLDGSIRTSNPLSAALHYEAMCSGRLPLESQLVESMKHAAGMRYHARHEEGYTDYAGAIDPQIRKYAQDVVGALAAQRTAPVGQPDVLDERMANLIEAHLRSKFHYTMDLTDVNAPAPGENPIVPFLLEFKRGHCTFFAAAMVQMCQSLGMRARMVSGYCCDEYSAIAQHYIVRQSHAHAWVEVLTPSGWQTFDPTSGILAPNAAAATVWQNIKHFFGFLEYKWENSVIAYNNDHRENLVNALNQSLSKGAEHGGKTMFDAKAAWQNLKAWLDSRQTNIPAGVWLALILLLAATMVGLVARYVATRWQIRRRARRMGLAALPPAERLRLARQLGFYSDMMRLLARHRLKKPPQLTPREFSQSLRHLPADAFETVQGLTRVFYKIRYGRHDLPAGQQKHLRSAVARLKVDLKGGGSTDLRAVAKRGA